MLLHIFTPLYIELTFGLTALLTVGFFYYATRRSNVVIGIILAITVIQLLIAGTDFYAISTVPPRFSALILPSLILVLMVFVLPKGRAFVDSSSLRLLTYMHMIRIPVEIVLYWLYGAGHLPEILTFSGLNFDILAGLSAPVVAYLYFDRKTMGKGGFLIWNVISLGLLLNIVIHAFLSIPTPFQLFGLDQANIAMLYPPFILLPAVVVPLVLFAHIAAIRAHFKK